MVLSVLRKHFKKQKLLSFYKKYIGKGDLCFDIGANIGERTEAFLKKIITAIVEIIICSNCI